MKNKTLFLFLMLCFYFCNAQKDIRPISTTEAIENFLATLSPDQTKIAHLSFSDSSRLKWSNLPMEETTRQGIQFKDLSDTQKVLVHRILRTVLSQQGYQKILFIMQYDEELHQRMLTANNQLARKYGANNYFVTWFADKPQARTHFQFADSAMQKKLQASKTKNLSETSGFKFEGHHISINLTISSTGEVISCTPLFTGVNPAQTTSGLSAGKYIMADENELGQALFQSLSPELQKKATAGDLPHEADVVMEHGKRKMETGDYKTFPFNLNSGIAYTEMDTHQKDLVKKIILSWANNFNEVIVEKKLKKINSKLDKMRFTWLGTNDVEKLHYYRLESPDFIIEFTNRDQGQYHFHSLWRMLN